MNKITNNKAWFLVLPVFFIVAISAIIPLMTVVNYSVQDIFDPQTRFFVGTEWFEQVLGDSRLHDALLRQIFYTLSVLFIEIPLGIAVALTLPRKGWGVSASMVLLALPLLIPWNVVGTIWQIFGRADIGLGGYVINLMGIDYNYGRLDHSTCHGCLALDQPDCAVVLCWLAVNPGCLLSGGQD